MHIERRCAFKAAAAAPRNTFRSFRRRQLRQRLQALAPRARVLQGPAPLTSFLYGCNTIGRGRAIGQRPGRTQEASSAPRRAGGTDPGGAELHGFQRWKIDNRTAILRSMAAGCDLSHDSLSEAPSKMHTRKMQKYDVILLAVAAQRSRNRVQRPTAPTCSPYINEEVALRWVLHYKSSTFPMHYWQGAVQTYLPQAQATPGESEQLNMCARRPAIRAASRPFTPRPPSSQQHRHLRRPATPP